MANSLPKKKCRLFTIVFVVVFLASACVIFLGSSLYQKQKSDAAFAASVIYKNDAFASNVIKYLNDPSSRETKKNITSPLSAARTAHQYKNALLLDKNKNVKGHQVYYKLLDHIKRQC
jgi:uncharacterized membrane protein